MNNVRKIPSLKMDDFIMRLMKRWNTKGFFINCQDIHDTFNPRPFRAEYYAIGVCTAGFARVMINGEELLYDKNSCAVLLPSTVSEVLEVSGDYQAMSVYFEKEFLLNDTNGYLFDKYQLMNRKGIPYIKIEDQETRLVTEYLQRLRSKMEDIDHLFRDSIIRSQLVSLISELEHMYLLNDMSAPRLNPRIGREKILSDFKKLLKECFKKEHHTSFYADALNISTKYLNEILKETTGKTTKNLISEALLTEAKILLRTGRFNVSEVAVALEYDNLEVFSRFFKKHTGMSPLQYKRS
ncbi:hypothetical protein DRF59_11245 [Chryseobacterium flavum]|uniref:HTH araC/xylS-type domain-containing protein n=1 Tax=Chryseobacterium flavum TaxID=415851 RepID=A0A3D9CMD1_9FLAO|nr:helix-turn-helix domain-containing protein [Chryseobacterium flavum]REC66874.1 hypothetical protein DRF59_11245 [Chryseobacterium flavum]